MKEPEVANFASVLTDRWYMGGCLEIWRNESCWVESERMCKCFIWAHSVCRLDPVRLRVYCCPVCGVSISYRG